MEEAMEQSEFRRKELATLPAKSPESQEELQLLVSTDFTNLSALNHQAGATEKQDANDGAQAANIFDANIDKIQLAQAAVDYRPKQRQVSNMESIKALLRNFLVDIRGPQNDQSSYCGELLSQWLDIWRTDRNPALLIYVLGDTSEQYKDRRLDVNALESVDKIKTNLLEQQCSRKGACIFLAKMTSAVNTDPEDAHGLKTAISLHEIRELSGELAVNKPVTVGRQSIIQIGLLSQRYHGTIARRNSYGSPAEGPPVIQTDTAKSFQDWVLVMMPQGCKFKFLTENLDPQELHEWITTQTADLQQSGLDRAATDQNVRWGLAQACKTQLNNIATWIAQDLCDKKPQMRNQQTSMLEAVVCGSLRLRDPGLFGKAITLDPYMLPLTKWEEVGSMMELTNFLSYRHILNQALKKIDSFQDRYMILLSVREGCEAQKEPQQSMSVIDDWFREQIEQAFGDIHLVQENDGAILVLVARKFAQTIDIHRIISFAKKHSSTPEFAVEYTFSLYDELAGNNIDKGKAQYLLTEILSVAVPNLCVRSAHNWSLQPWSPSRALHASLQNRQILQADRMARLVRCCRTVGLDNETHSLLRHFWLDAGVADAPTLQHVFLPYLKQLLVVMHDYSIPLTTPRYQWQFQRILSLFITHYIGREPTLLSRDFTFPPLGCANPTRLCGCATCLTLDSFLVDPHRESVDITGDMDAPEHVAARIQGREYLQMAVVSSSAETSESTVRITKTVIKTEEPGARHDLWAERVVKANDLIQAVCGDEEWKVLLGDKYDECMGLKLVMTA